MNFLKKLLDSLEFYILAGVLFVVVWYFVLSPRNIDGVSMFPYFHNFDYILMYKLEYLSSTPQRGDIVVFKHSAVQDYIKRVIALPGEEILLQSGKVYINGKLLDETQYLSTAVYTAGENAVQEGIPYVVPQGHYFLMGDNRPNSTDSREFGAIPKETIEGRAVLVWFPFNNTKIVPRIQYKISSYSLENIARNNA
jgi:signal peptidase I